jgi:hypothetical protein
MEVIFAAWIDSDVAILAFNFFAKKVRINGQLFGHHRSSLQYRTGLAGYGPKYSHLKSLCQEQILRLAIEAMPGWAEHDYLSRITFASPVLSFALHCNESIQRSDTLNAASSAIIADSTGRRRSHTSRYFEKSAPD